MALVEVFTLDFTNNTATHGSSYIVKNIACDTAALINPPDDDLAMTKETIRQIRSITGSLEWIFLTHKPYSLHCLKAIQAKCGGIIAGSKAALQPFEKDLFTSKSQFALLTNKQLVLLGHIDLLVDSSGHEGQLSYLIENNLFTQGVDGPIESRKNLPFNHLPRALNTNYYFV